MLYGGLIANKKRIHVSPALVNVGRLDLEKTRMNVRTLSVVANAHRLYKSARLKSVVFDPL